MAIYEHYCFECEGIFEEIYSWRDEPPTTCSLCGAEGKVKRIPSLPARGQVILTGQELKAKTFEDAGKLRAQMQTDEKLRANLIGEDTFHANTKQHDNDMRDVAKSDRNIADKFRP